VGYHRAGFDVVGVDLRPQPNYPFRFVQADALAVLDLLLSGATWEGYILADFAAIHASPPCQGYSSLKSMHPDNVYPDLYVPVRDRCQASGLSWVIENVIGAPYRSGVILCGSMFGLRIRRHRNFESSVLMLPPTCQHKAQGQPIGIYGNGGGYKRDRGWKAKPCEKAALMGMPWATPREITQAIPPVYAEWIGAQLLDALAHQSASAHVKVAVPPPE
jgi:DNA (cytosine-5)-methyltransferase 1